MSHIETIDGKIAEVKAMLSDLIDLQNDVENAAGLSGGRASAARGNAFRASLRQLQDCEA